MDIFELFKKIEKKEDTKTPITHMIVGLGNPGEKYTTTRHNAGFLTLSYAAKKWGCSITTSKFDALVGEAVVGGNRTLLLLPQTFMNNSGVAVSKAAKFYKIPVENITVVYDDTSFEPGTFKIKKKGSAGGHNGVKSLIEYLGTEEFKRIKIGVGKKPHPEMILADWVLTHFTQEELKKVESRFDDACEALVLMNKGETDKAMNNFNS